MAQKSGHAEDIRPTLLNCTTLPRRDIMHFAASVQARAEWDPGPGKLRQLLRVKLDAGCEKSFGGLLNGSS